MLVLILGGSASGKSEFAEALALTLGSQKLYIATMKPFDAECVQRIAKHQGMRSQKGFATQEVYSRFDQLTLAPPQGAPYDLVLLECVSNLLANELYAKGDGALTIQAIITGVERILAAAPNLIIVSNQVFEDGDCYDPATLGYIDALGAINATLAQKAQVVIEVVAGLPIYHKGEAVIKGLVPKAEQAGLRK